MFNVYHIQAALSITILCLVHLFANRMVLFGWLWHGRFLSFAGGISFAYVFVSLLPEVAAGQDALAQALSGFFPNLERHAYVVALLGFLFFYSLQKTNAGRFHLHFWASMCGYTIFNLLIGMAVADSDNPDVRPLSLFTLAMALHYFVNDHNLREKHKEEYEKRGRWILTGALLVGWTIGFTTKIPEALIALLVAFAAGGVLLNVMLYELPKKEQGGTMAFCFGALLYTVVLLSVGEREITHVEKEYVQ